MRCAHPFRASGQFVLLHHQTGRRCGALILADLVAPGLLGGIHRSVGMAREFVQILAMLGVQADAAAEPQRQGHALQHEWLHALLHEFARHHTRLLGAANGWQQQNELVPALAAHRVGLPHHGLQAA